MAAVPRIRAEASYLREWPSELVFGSVRSQPIQMTSVMLAIVARFLGMAAARNCIIGRSTVRQRTLENLSLAILSIDALLLASATIFAWRELKRPSLQRFGPERILPVFGFAVVFVLVAYAIVQT